MFDRKKFYLFQFQKTLPVLLESQKIKGRYSGCFHDTFVLGQEQVNSRWQEAVLSLKYFNQVGNKNLLPKIIQGIRFWCDLQNEDGSFPELDCKQSYAATAFGSLSIGRTYIGLESELSGIEDLLFETLEKSCKYLKNNEVPQSNQEMAAGLALIECSEFLGKYRRHGFGKVKKVIKSQKKDGIYPENGGSDLGYCSLTMEMLGDLWIREGKKYILNSVGKFLDWLKYFVFPDGSVGGCYNTRKPGWLILNGFEIFKENFPICESIIRKHIEGHNKGLFDCTHLIDKRHFMTDSFRLFHAYKNYKKIRRNLPQLPSQKKEWKRHFPTNDIYIAKKKDYMAIISLSDISKNGLTLWTKEGMIIDLSDCSPNLVEIQKKVSGEKYELSGYPWLYRRLFEKTKLLKIWNLSKHLIPKNKIIYKIGDEIDIQSNRVICLPFLGSGKEKSTQLNKSSIFFKRNDYYVDKIKKKKLAFRVSSNNN